MYYFPEMNQEQIWQYALDKKIAFSHPFDRDFVWIKKNDFNKIKKHFRKEYNFLHPGKSFRTSAYLKHIHAVEQSEYVFIHFDFGNSTRFWPLVVFHFLADVLPYFLFCLIKRKPLNFYFQPLDIS